MAIEGKRYAAKAGSIAQERPGFLPTRQGRVPSRRFRSPGLHPVRRRSTFVDTRVKRDAEPISSSIWNAISLLTCCRIAVPIALKGDFLRICASRPVREGEQPQSGCVRGGGVGLRARKIASACFENQFRIHYVMREGTEVQTSRSSW
jgi:hypothetical protein